MTQQTETLWQVGKPGRGKGEFVQAGGWQAEFTYKVGTDPDPINQPQIPSTLVVPDLNTKPRQNGRELFATDKLNIDFTLTQSYGPGELTLFYSFYGSETDTVVVDGQKVTDLVGVKEGRLNRHQVVLPALTAGDHRITLTTKEGSGSHSIDFLKLDGIVAPQPSPTSQQMIKSTQRTPSGDGTLPQPSHIPTSMTGLQDYSYWWQYARERAQIPEAGKSFRRGRIWV